MLKELLQDRRAKFGTFLVEFNTPGIGYLLKGAGCDFVLFDMEHSGFTLDAVKTMLRYLEAAALPAIVGMPSKDPQHIHLVLDMGAEGIMSPMVESVAEAEQFIEKMKYPPQGRRAVSLRVAHDRYGYPVQPVAQMMASANAQNVYFAKIETVAGVDNVEQIAALGGVDGLWIGHVDLSASMGIPGQLDHPEFTAAVERIVAACRANAKPLGRLVGSVEEGAALHRSGFDFIGYSADAWILQDALGSAIAALRERCRSN